MSPTISKITALSLLALASLSSAKTDIEGCTTTATVNEYNEAINLWYVPGTGEVCEFLDCGGGRAPPKYDVPGCAAYTGTDTYSPSYINLPTSSQPTPTAGAGSSTPVEAEQGTITPVATLPPAASTLSKAPIGTGSGSPGLPSNGTTVTTGGHTASPPPFTGGAAGRGGKLAGVLALVGLVAL